MPLDFAGDVPPGHLCRKKVDRTNGLPRLPAWPSVFGPMGRCLCHLISWALNQQRRDAGSVLSSLQIEKVAWISAMWTGTADTLVWDIVSSLKNYPRWNEDEPPGAAAHPIQSETPRREREGTLAEVQLAKVREAHWKSLATTMALEEEIV